MTRVLIMAGGADEKWAALGGQERRHFQDFLGERVIDRLIRQLRDLGITDIGIICPEQDGYRIPGTWRVLPSTDAWGMEGLNGQAFWSDSGRTLMIYGDTIFADGSIRAVVEYNVRRFVMFGRFGNGPIKGGGGELFAFSFFPEQRQEWRDAVLESVRLRDEGTIKRAGSWEGYRIMAGARGEAVGRHRRYPGSFFNIRDGRTDDFDTPEQFRKLLELHTRLDAGSRRLVLSPPTS